MATSIGWYSPKLMATNQPSTVIRVDSATWSSDQIVESPKSSKPSIKLPKCYGSRRPKKARNQKGKSR